MLVYDVKELGWKVLYPFVESLVRHAGLVSSMFLFGLEVMRSGGCRENDGGETEV